MSLPSPLTPADCDLRGLDWMPLHGHRLFNSELYSMALLSPRAGVAALKLWWIAWQQCPAGSLPDDDRALARFADFGNDLRGWRRARDVALRGFVLCSDGRLYHPLICKEAMDTYDRRQRATRKKRHQRAENDTRLSAGCQPAVTRLSAGCQPVADRLLIKDVKPLENKETEPDVPGDVPGTSPAYRTGQDRTVSKKEDAVLSAGVRADARGAVEIISAFNRARIEAHGERLGIRFPAQHDRTTAQRWIDAGVRSGLTEDVAVAVACEAITTAHQRRAARGLTPIGTLAYCEKLVLEAIAYSGAPAPEVPSPQDRPSRYAHLRQFELSETEGITLEMEPT